MVGEKVILIYFKPLTEHYVDMKKERKKRLNVYQDLLITIELIK